MTVLATMYKLSTDNFDYTINWADVLVGAETISTSTWTIPAGLVGSGASFTTTTARTYISGGTTGLSYTITDTITTSGGNTYSQSFVIVISEVPDTSGIAIFNVTRNEIIELAHEDLKVFAPDFETLAPAQYTRANKRLNMMIKAMQAAGVGLWLNTVHTQVLTASTQSYLLGPYGTPPIARPLGVVDARLVTTAGNETILTPMSRDEYMALPLKSSTGKPNQYYYDAQIGNGVFYVWPVATDLTDVIKITVRTQIQDFVNLDDQPYFPVEWCDYLHYGLAMRLISVYSVPADIANHVKQMAAVTLADADGFDREQNVSVQFSPDMESLR